MKTLTINCCCSLIQQLTEFSKENPNETLRLVINDFVYSTEDALGAMDVIEFWSSKIDMIIDIRFTNSHFALLVAASLPMSKIRLSKGCAIIFQRARHFEYGTLTDISISTAAAKDIEEQANAILVAHYGFEKADLEKWLDETAIIRAPKIVEYGVQLIPGAI